jgi:hypothetical protein
VGPCGSSVVSTPAKRKGQATGFETDLALTTAIMVGTKGTRSRWC